MFKRAAEIHASVTEDIFSHSNMRLSANEPENERLYRMDLIELYRDLGDWQVLME